MTDPRIFSGIGNAYSDEILHRAKLSPFALSGKLSSEETARLHAAARDVLGEWIARLRDEAGDDFPEKVTAFRSEMAVHGRFGQPCPVCARPCNVSATPTTRPITVRAAKPADVSWPTARFRDSCTTPGQSTWMTWENETVGGRL